MLDLNELLRFTVEQRGSDLHIKVGSPPHVRVDGHLLVSPFDVVSPADAEKLRIRKGETVVVQSRYGSASLPVRVTRRVKPGEVFATFHDARVFLNRVTSPHRDRYVKSPEYKVTAVRIVKLDDPPRELPTIEAKEVR